MAFKTIKWQSLNIWQITYQKGKQASPKNSQRSNCQMKPLCNTNKSINWEQLQLSGLNATKISRKYLRNWNISAEKRLKDLDGFKVTFKLQIYFNLLEYNEDNKQSAWSISFMSLTEFVVSLKIIRDICVKTYAQWRYPLKSKILL